jgi:excisionase family DNA binding protein
MAVTSESRQIGEPIALSVKDACKLGNLGRTTLYQLIKSGCLPARKCGRRTIIFRSDLEAALKALPQIGGRPA